MGGNCKVFFGLANLAEVSTVAVVPPLTKGLNGLCSKLVVPELVGASWAVCGVDFDFGTPPTVAEVPPLTKFSFPILVGL